MTTHKWEQKIHIEHMINLYRQIHRLFLFCKYNQYSTFKQFIKNFWSALPLNMPGTRIVTVFPNLGDGNYLNQILLLSIR